MQPMPPQTMALHSRPPWRPQPSLKVIMPINDKTDLQFYNNMWLGDSLFTVCDQPGPACSMSCNQTSTYKSLDDKTRCFMRHVKSQMKDIQFFIKLNDDAFVDKDYIMGLMEKYKNEETPVYISDFIHNRDPVNEVLTNSYYGNGKFYMFNRKLVDCFATELRYHDHQSKDLTFGGMVHFGCGANVLRIKEDDSKIWHKGYKHRNKEIDLAALRNH
ncbi:hypothetical protein H4217_003260 [Coemansia sp. RSA 1939]|nr:hypothetical protein H4217_003260 [Coemansia sp. RSA 1939]KAJ2615661.1 hypothetical protein EV177_001467 [Coemansia sp. RSA 1804]